MERNPTSGMSSGNGLSLGLERLSRPDDGTGLSADERRELWDRLQAFALDEIDAHAPFSARLAREQGWSRAFARQVIEEYKKFLYLGCVGEHPVTPSEQVDAAWHLHMIYTRSYWNDLCPRVLGRPFHHGPSKGGAKEQRKFHDWYERTLRAYEACFGYKPPADIWPAAGERFATRARWVDLNTHWVIPKRLGWLAGKRGGVAGGVGIASLAMAGCGVTLGQGGTSTASAVIALAVMGAVLIVIVVMIARLFGAGAGRRPRARRGGSDGFTPMVFFGDGGDESQQGREGMGGEGGGDGGGGGNGGGSGCGGGGGCGGGCG